MNSLACRKCGVKLIPGGKPPLDTYCRDCFNAYRRARRAQVVEKNVVALLEKLPSNRREVLRIVQSKRAAGRVKKVEKKERKQRVARKRQTLEEKLKKAEEEQKMMPQVSVVDEGPVDVLRDTKWVYENLGRLIVRNNLGLEQLDEDTLKEAPSNGAIGLAHYCLNDRKAFFEKYALRIMQKEDEDKGEPTEEELAEEHDPDFSDLKQYLQRLEQDDDN
jgi:hypothetical protein